MRFTGVDPAHSSMVAHVSKWVVPVDQPPLRDGAVVVKGDRIYAVGPAKEVLTGFSGLICEHGDGAILPGVVNCHIHLEFSALAGRVPPQARWEDWLTATLALQGELSPEDVKTGMARAMDALWQTGTSLVGEVSNSGASLPFLQTSPLAYHLFYECLGFHLIKQLDLPQPFPFFKRPEIEASRWISAAAHAPYSVSAALFKAVDKWNAARLAPQMVHLSESQAEVDFLAGGNDFFEGLLKQRGRWVPEFQRPGVSPAAYLHSLNFLGSRTLTVHGVWLSIADVKLLAATGAWLVLCPRANRYTGAGIPPVSDLLQAGVKLALGTDSLAGNWDLNLFGEIFWLKQNFPSYPGDLWLRLGTLQGAQALGREQDFGSLTPGKKAIFGFIPLDGTGEFWSKLYSAGAAGQWRWL